MINLEKLGLKILNGAYNIESDGCYVGDILSYALAKLKKGNIWITSQTNINVIAIAFTKEVSCVILPDSLTLCDEVLKKAIEHNVNVFSSQKSAYDVAIQIYEACGGHYE